MENIDGLVQDCSNSIANALKLLQFCAKPSTYTEKNGWIPDIGMISDAIKYSKKNGAYLRWQNVEKYVIT